MKFERIKKERKKERKKLKLNLIRMSTKLDQESRVLFGWCWGNDPTWVSKGLGFGLGLPSRRLVGLQAVPVLVRYAFLEVNKIDVNRLEFVHPGWHERLLERHGVALFGTPHSLDALRIQHSTLIVLSSSSTYIYSYTTWIKQLTQKCARIEVRCRRLAWWIRGPCCGRTRLSCPWTPALVRSVPSRTRCARVDWAASDCARSDAREIELRPGWCCCRWSSPCSLEWRRLLAMMTFSQIRATHYACFLMSKILTW